VKYLYLGLVVILIIINIVLLVSLITGITIIIIRPEGLDVKAWAINYGFLLPVVIVYNFFLYRAYKKFRSFKNAV